MLLYRYFALISYPDQHNKQLKIPSIINIIFQKRQVLLPKAHCVFLTRVPRNTTLSFFNGNVLFFHVKFPSNRPRLLFGASYSIAAKKIIKEINKQDK